MQSAFEEVLTPHSSSSSSHTRRQRSSGTQGGGTTLVFFKTPTSSVTLHTQHRESINDQLCTLVLLLLHCLLLQLFFVSNRLGDMDSAQQHIQV